MLLRHGSLRHLKSALADRSGMGRRPAKTGEAALTPPPNGPNGIFLTSKSVRVFILYFKIDPPGMQKLDLFFLHVSQSQ